MYGSIETLNDLIESLQEISDSEFDGKPCGELPVRIAYQQSWPLVGCIAELTVCKKDGKAGVWIAECAPSYSENPYAPRSAWEGGFEGYDFDVDSSEGDYGDEEDEEW